MLLLEEDVYPDSGTLPLIVDMPILGYHNALNLTEEARKIITEPLKDNWKISLINNIPYGIQRRLGYAVNALNRRHYAQMHGIWINGEKIFLGQRLGHEPRFEELDADFKRTHVPEIFRLFYLLTCPEKMALSDRTVNGEADLFHDFLSTAEQISGGEYRGRFMRIQFVPAFEPEAYRGDFQI